MDCRYVKPAVRPSDEGLVGALHQLQLREGLVIDFLLNNAVFAVPIKHKPLSYHPVLRSDLVAHRTKWRIQAMRRLGTLTLVTVLFAGLYLAGCDTAVSGLSSTATTRT